MADPVSAAAPSGGAPADASGEEYKIVGQKGGFKRTNPMTDRTGFIRFDHLEFWSGDSTSCARRFCVALGMQLIARSDLSTGNELYSSYAMRTGDITFVCTSPMGERGEELTDRSIVSFPSYDQKLARRLIDKHGTFVRAVGLEVTDSKQAHNAYVANGGKSVSPPKEFHHPEMGCVITSEVEMYEDVCLRFVQRKFVDKPFSGTFLPGFVDEPFREPIDYGLYRIDHVVSNVPALANVIPLLIKRLGFHPFAEFVTADVGTDESGLNSVVLASNNELLLMPFNEPTFGTKRKSQIEMYLDYNVGPGIQHIAIKTNDIFKTLAKMKASGAFGGVEFVPHPGKAYYERLPGRLGDKLTPEQYKLCDEFGVLADTDPEGELLQIFTRPIFDRPTVFIEIIQRVGCSIPEDHPARKGPAAVSVRNVPEEALKEVPRGALPFAQFDDQKPGCGGFGKGNFGELFRSIEDYEKQIEKVRLEARSKTTLTIVDA
eukprot:TRINITY_DN4056_c0_g1_i1.p1 TRINITY_DN4056_c0_g1~~TRINITY_DN4056_c0_g1_i1.p1  ORF type:complete len:500 (+),score=166.73 TRINITY_DN4056_c0_g1_i1:38-1501(+)